jgi:hypothetical protein
MNKRVLLIMPDREFAEKDGRVELKPENVREDPDLSRMEKETILRFAKDQDRATLHTDNGALVRRAIRHPRVKIETHNVHEGSITSIRATLPIGLVSISGKPRKDSGQASVISPSSLRDTEDGD